MKDMEKYIKAIARRLNLPRDVKARVMSDLVSSIRARQEVGETPDEIIAELGSAAKVAAELNEQMKEFAYRKSPWRYLFAVLAAYGAARVLKLLFGQILYWIFQIQVRQETASIGVIGGADGPTAIFVTSDPAAGYIIAVVLLIVGIWGFFRLSRCLKK